MMREAKDKGLLIFEDRLANHIPVSDGHMHDSRGSFFTRWYRTKTRSWNSDTHGKPVVHESVTQRTRNRGNEEDPKYDPWILKMDYEVET